MKHKCEIVRDLLPLYLDNVASEASRRMVDEHLAECEECTALYCEMKDNELEREVIEEKTDVIARQRRVFKRKSALAGCVIAGILMIPILVCLIVNLANGAGLTWFFIVLASLLVAASLTVVPLTVPENRLLWTLGAFTLSLIMLLGVCAIYTHGRWFWVVGSSVLFGMTAVFSPFAVRSRPIRAVLKNHKALAVMAADTLLFALMMTSIGLYMKAPDFFIISAAISLPPLMYAWAMFASIRYIGKNGLTRAGLCVSISGLFIFFADALTALIMGMRVTLPAFAPLEWGWGTLDGNMRWIALITGVLAGAALIIIGLIHRRKQR